jgi:hypothetical protein
LEFTKLSDQTLQILDNERLINCQYNITDQKLHGKGSTKYRKDILSEIEANYKDEGIFTDKHKDEIFALAEVVSTWGSSTTTNNVKVEDLYKWLTNPLAFNQQLRNLALYWYGEKGLVTETLELYKTLPNLNSSIKCNNPSSENYDKLLAKIKDLDADLLKKSTLRDIIFHTALEGTSIGYINNKKYIQLLDLNAYYPARMVNGRWQADVDLSKFISIGQDSPQLLLKNSTNTILYIENQPLEVRQAWDSFNKLNKVEKKKKSNYLYSLNMNNHFVIKIRCKQNERWGRPVAMGAFTALLHKELLQEAEKSVIDRIIKIWQSFI